MMVSRKREFLENAITGALPPLAVVAYEVFLKQFAETRQWTLIVSLILFYFTAVALIYAIDKILEIVRNTIRIEIPGAGHIDGWWVDVVRGLGGQSVGGATIHIKSCEDHLLIRGRIYSLDGEELRERGYFDAVGYVMIDETVAYYYKGYLNNELDVGSGHYTFQPPTPPAKDTHSFRGSFIGIKAFDAGPKHQPAHRTVGFRVPKTLGQQAPQEDEAQKCLLGCLKDESKKTPPAAPQVPRPSP